ncbi:hypothetical protein [Methermicoccus shengliensis]|uniref:hypothetical protein n=1 Tax=Methermicoccus shengliensis TaxID=660064 RepID=UPI0006949636|nr:hypothetical protein [Methermicoccus shengliensis]
MDKKKPHHTVVYDKTGFKVFGMKIRLSIPEQLGEYLKKECGYSQVLWQIVYQIGIVYSVGENCLHHRRKGFNEPFEEVLEEDRQVAIPQGQFEEQRPSIQ